MSHSFWNERYTAKAFAYGENPNAFIEESFHHIPQQATVLELGAGEGRNSVFLSKQGHHVTALDYAQEGLEKLKQLAQKNEVQVETIQADIQTWEPKRQWDSLVISFLHVLPDQKQPLFDLIKRCLAPEGIFIAEWFHPNQIREGYPSGGPKNIEMMISKEELDDAFSEGKIHYLQEQLVSLEEGLYHRGMASTTRLIWQK